MRDKPWWLALLILVVVGLVKAHLHMIRLVILLAVGLGGMYMLHILAQDFNKIRQGWPFPQRPMGGRLLSVSSGIFKRSTDEVELRNEVDMKRQLLTERLTNDTREFPNILRNDPIGCARKYVCHISGRTRAKLTRTQDNVLTLLRTFQWLDTTGEWARAEQLGKRKAKEGACETEFTKCFYTGAQLEKFMNLL